MKVAVSSGGRFHSIELAEQLQRLGADYTLYTGASIPSFIPRSRVRSFRIVPILSFALRKLAVSEELKRRIAVKSDNAFDHLVASQIKTDIDLFHGFSVYSLFTMRKLNKKSNALTLIDRGSAPAQEYDELVSREYAKYGKKFWATPAAAIAKQDSEYREADAILSPSEYVTECLVKRKLAERDKIFQLPYGAPPVLKQEPRAEKFRVLFIGGAGIAKGLHYLVQAFNHFTQVNKTNAELLIVGKVENDFPVKTENSNIRFVQKLVGKNLEEAFLSSSVLALPSISDGWGMVVTEAMSAGLPVIVSENTGAKDAVRDSKTGFIVPACSSHAIKDALHFLHDNPKKARKMGKEGKKLAAKYTWNHYGERLVKIYNQLLSE